MHDCVTGPQDAFEELVRNADMIIERMIEEKQNSRTGLQDMGVHMSNTLHDCRTVLQIDQLSDDVHLVSQIALKFKQGGKETMQQMHADLSQCHLLSQRAPNIVAGIPVVCGGH